MKNNTEKALNHYRDVSHYTKKALKTAIEEMRATAEHSNEMAEIFLQRANELEEHLNAINKDLEEL